MPMRVLVCSVALIPLWTCNLMAFWGSCLKVGGGTFEVGH